MRPPPLAMSTCPRHRSVPATLPTTVPVPLRMYQCLLHAPSVATSGSSLQLKIGFLCYCSFVRVLVTCSILLVR